MNTIAIKARLCKVWLPRIYLYFRGKFDQRHEKVDFSKEGVPDSVMLQRYRHKYASFAAAAYGNLEGELRAERDTAEQKRSEINRSKVDPSELVVPENASVDVIRAVGKKRKQFKANEQRMDELYRIQKHLKSQETEFREYLLSVAHSMASKLESYAAGAFGDHNVNLGIDRDVTIPEHLYRNAHEEKGEELYETLR